MGAWLAGCLGSIVATAAVPAYPAVVEPRRIPAGHAVTGCAVLRGLDVIGRLAHRLDAVVTAGAISGHTRVIETGHLPLLGGVTTVARGLGANVVGGHAPGADGVVARRTVLGRSLELRVLMTAFAPHGGVRAGEREASLEMVEGLACYGPGRGLLRASS